MGREYRKFAFISYSHRDMGVAKWLQRRLEHFRLPTESHNEIEAGCRYLRPVFRDQSDLNTGILSDELRTHLEESKFLILICSKDSAASQWVSDEAKAFVEMGRLDRIIPVIIPDGTTAETDLFPKYLREYFAEHPEQVLLGVNIGEVGREKALIRVVSRMLGLSFDTLWQRHRRQRRIRIAIGSVASAIAIAATYLFAIPVDVEVTVDFEPSQLPIGETTTVTVDGAEFTTPIKGPHADMILLPGYKRFSDIRVSATSTYLRPVDTLVATGFGMRRDIALTMRRDDTFAIYAGTIYDPEMEPLEGVTVRVAGRTATTGTDGSFEIRLPVEEQRISHAIELSKPGYETRTRDDEPPTADISFIMRPL